MIESVGLAAILGLLLVMLFFAGRIAHEQTVNWPRALRAHRRAQRAITQPIDSALPLPGVAGRRCLISPGGCQAPTPSETRGGLRASGPSPAYEAPRFGREHGTADAILPTPDGRQFVPHTDGAKHVGDELACET